MIKFKRIDTGEYISEDDRFHILHTWDVIHGNHWVLFDNAINDYYKRQHHYYTLKECKSVANRIIFNEKLYKCLN